MAPIDPRRAERGDLTIFLSPEEFTISYHPPSHRASSGNAMIEKVTPDGPISGNKNLELLEKLMHKVSSDEDAFRSAYFCSPYSTLIPEAVHKEGSEKEVLELPFSEIFDEENIRVDHIETLGTYLIYWFPKKLEEPLVKAYPNIHILHHHSILLDYFLQYERTTRNEPGIYVHIRENEMDLFLFDDNELLLANTQEYHSYDELVYFIMNTRERSGLGKDLQRVTVTGTIPVKKEWKDLLSTYMEKVEVRTREEGKELCSPILFRDQECVS